LFSLRGRAATSGAFKSIDVDLQTDRLPNGTLSAAVRPLLVEGAIPNGVSLAVHQNQDVNE